MSDPHKDTNDYNKGRYGGGYVPESQSYWQGVNDRERLNRQQPEFGDGGQFITGIIVIVLLIFLFAG